MRCFEVEVNGERYCLAGVGDVGALSAFVTCVGVRGPDGATVAGPTYLSVSGFSGSVEDQRPVHWREGIHPLAPGANCEPEKGRAVTQPLSADLERALAREFPPDQQTAARSMLAGYGVAAHEREVERVRRALLALSQGRLAYLGHYLAVAQHDYRDVLYWADHPEQAPKR